MERLFALWNHAMQKPWIAKCWQIIKFGIVGVSNTLISLAVYQLALNALGLHYLAANALGLVISVVNAYYWNNRCVFGGGQNGRFEACSAVFQIADSLRGYLRAGLPAAGFLGGGGWHSEGTCACAQPVHHHSAEFFY